MQSKRIETVAYIHILDEKILLTKSKGKNAFYMPGGKRDEGEDDPTALVREIKEELGVDLHKDSLNYFGQFEAQAYGHDEGITVCITCYFGTHKGTVAANTEIEEIAFFSYDEYLAQNEIAPTAKIILEALKEKQLIL